MSNEMTLREHLDELRRRLIWVVIFITASMIAAFAFRDLILGFLLEPGFSKTGEKPIATEVLEVVGVTFKVTFMVGLVVSLPVVIYQIVRFVSPGLTKREKIYLVFFIPVILIAFIAGDAFAYYVLFPPAFEFLFNFGTNNVDPEIRVSSYINVVISLMFWMGTVFQIPLVMFFLARLGVVTPRWLGKFRKYAVVLAFVAAAIITPTFDPVNQTLVAIPIIVLYEIAILKARIGRRLRKRKT